MPRKDLPRVFGRSYSYDNDLESFAHEPHPDLTAFILAPNSQAETVFIYLRDLSVAYTRYPSAQRRGV
jgi:hypothetical protein